VKKPKVVDASTLHRVIAERDALRAELEAIAKPIPLLLNCPGILENGQVCGARHIDRGEWATTRSHTTHACQRCGHTWRPAVVATVGVEFLPGFKNA
jgi:hypothetical protein